MKLLLSKLFSLLPEVGIKNRLRCYLYNFRNKDFVIHFNNNLYQVDYPHFKLVFEQNPYHLLVEQKQYNKDYQLKESDVVIDAGGFWGTYSLVASKQIGNSGRVIVFEPDDRNYEQLIKNIQLNRIENISVIKKGLWSKEDSLPFSMGNELGSSLLEGEKTKMIEVTTLDATLRNLGLNKIDFIKMDIEGAEIEAMDGAEQVLNAGTNLAIASYHIVDNQPTYIKLEKILRKKGYQATTIDHGESITYAKPHI